LWRQRFGLCGIILVFNPRAIDECAEVNLKDIPEQERKSPNGKFSREMNEISVMLGT
jgi:hypothetical protein